MTEKLLKGYLIFKRKRFPKIHEIDKLAKLAEEVNPDFKEIEKEAQYLTGFYISSGYPGDYPQYSLKEAREAFRKVTKINILSLRK